MQDFTYDECCNEDELQAYMATEGRNAWNEAPDGCYFCGSSHHHSGDCPERC